MKTIKFRPLRLIKKTGKITVSSYMQWRKVMTSNYSDFNLQICDDHKSFDKKEQVYTYKGESLFFYNYNPSDVPVFQWSILFDLDNIQENNEQYGIDWMSDGVVNYQMKGVDCDGVPTFSNYTIDEILNRKIDMSELVPLTVEIVDFWYGWFLYRLDNSNLKYINKK